MSEPIRYGRLLQLQDLGQLRVSAVVSLSAAPSAAWVDEFQEVIERSIFIPPCDVVEEQVRFETPASQLRRSLDHLRIAIDRTNRHLRDARPVSQEDARASLAESLYHELHEEGY